MSRLITAGLLACWPAMSASAAEPTQTRTPHPVTATFYVSNVVCGQCVEAISQSVRKVPSVTAVESLSPESGYARISFDTHVSSYHQIADAISRTPPEHGQTYVPSLYFEVAQYAEGENAARIDAVFARLADRVRIKPLDRQGGQFVLHFLPLKIDPKKDGPQGFNAGHLGHPINDPPPKGLGLTMRIKREAK